MRSIHKRGLSVAKPDWLIEAEKKKNNKIKFVPRTCGQCEYWGEPVRMVKVLGQTGKHVQRECAIHPGCFNTRFAYSCDDWSKSAK